MGSDDSDPKTAANGERSGGQATLKLLRRLLPHHYPQTWPGPSKPSRPSPQTSRPISRDPQRRLAQPRAATSASPPGPRPRGASAAAASWLAAVAVCLTVWLVSARTPAGSPARCTSPGSCGSSRHHASWPSPRAHRLGAPRLHRAGRRRPAPWCCRPVTVRLRCRTQCWGPPLATSSRAAIGAVIPRDHAAIVAVVGHAGHAGRGEAVASGGPQHCVRH